MSRIDLIPAEGNWYKANLHCHSTYSDGVLTPEQIKEIYKACGYSVVAFTDHNVLNHFSDLNDENFLALCGYEVDATNTPDDPCGFWKTCHLCLIAEDPEKAVFIRKPTAHDPAVINEYIRRYREAGYIVNYNHPGWSAEDETDYMALEGITCFEVYNHGCEVLDNNGDARAEYAKLLRWGKRAYPICTDDNHNPELKAPFRSAGDSCGGWTTFKAKELTYPAIIDALKNGHFYSSTGPQIYAYYVEDNKICIDCSPVRGIYLMSDKYGASAKRSSDRDELTHFEFDLANLRLNEPYVRFELADTMGRHAFTAPYYLR